jgi:LmbE family N-acetylglucosaminyl deacetylase
MADLTILSPHQDDAGLSLAMTIGAAAGAGHRVQIVNCFTVSEYAPYSNISGTAGVGRLRSEEDRRFASMMGSTVDVVDLGLRDAPIRLQCPISAVRRRPIGALERNEARQLADAVTRVAKGVLLVPIGLGTHIDHVVVREAGIRVAQSGQPVGFYEDLPYAAETRSCCAHRAVDGIARRLGAPLQPALVTEMRGVGRKREAIEGYASQISSAQLRSIIQYAELLGGFERLWMPAGVLAAFPVALHTAAIRDRWSAPPAVQWLRCATHTGADRVRAVVRRLSEIGSRGDRVHVPQSN